MQAILAVVLAVATSLWQPMQLDGIHARVYGKPVRAHPVLLVILHGDAPNENPSYQYFFAQRVADSVPNSLVAALLRPGYADGLGARSRGTRGLTTGDNYTPENIDAVDNAIAMLQTMYQPTRTILVGHSGGAAIAADILGRHPSTARNAFLIGCPCDVRAWRSYMVAKQSDPIWTRPVMSISPMTVANAVSRDAHVELIVGQTDDVTPRQFSDVYAKALRARNISADVVIVPHVGHNILNDDFILARLMQFVRQESR